jgi:hypothetical protein
MIIIEIYRYNIHINILMPASEQLEYEGHA